MCCCERLSFPPADCVQQMFVNFSGPVSYTLGWASAPPPKLFSESFVSPNGAWNILHMMRNSNKMNNKHPQPARAFYDALNENTEPHRRLIKANIWRCQWQMPNYAEADEWARSYLGRSSITQLGPLLLRRQAFPSQLTMPVWWGLGMLTHPLPAQAPWPPTTTALLPCPQGRGGPG